MRLDQPGSLCTPGPFGQASRLADAYHQLGDQRHEREAATLAHNSQPDHAYALIPQIRLSASLGRISDVTAWLDSALSYPDENRVDVGPLMTLAAQELRAHGYADVAGPILQRAIDWYEAIPEEPHAAVYPRFELARALALAGRLDEAEAVVRAIVPAEPDYVALNVGLLGTIEARRQDRGAAERYLAELDSLRPSLTRPDEIAGYWQACIRAILGDHDEAMRLLRQIFGPQGRDIHGVADFDSMLADPRFRELIRPKG
jgi:tetratricopeptide (TPR) repeat protein